MKKWVAFGVISVLVATVLSVISFPLGVMALEVQQTSTAVAEENG